MTCCPFMWQQFGISVHMHCGSAENHLVVTLTDVDYSFLLSIFFNIL